MGQTCRTQIISVKAGGTVRDAGKWRWAVLGGGDSILGTLLPFHDKMSIIY